MSECIPVRALRAPVANTSTLVLRQFLLQTATAALFRMKECVRSQERNLLEIFILWFLLNG